MKVKIDKRSNYGVRPDSSHLCIIDAKTGYECWFDYGKTGFLDTHIQLNATQWAPVDKLVYFTLPEEADNGKYGVWVRYESVEEKEDWLLNALLLDQARLVAAYLRDHWLELRPDTIPPEIAKFIAMSETQLATNPPSVI